MSTTTIAVKSVLGSPQIRLAAGGWIFFIAENALLSENRTALIDYLGDDQYHLLYGLCSTAATGAIGYAYFRLSGLSSLGPVSLFNRWSAFGFLSVGLILASQALPKMQIPLAIGSSSQQDGLQVQVRCPFDFSDKNNTTNNNNHQVTGMERVSRHPGLWSLGLVGAANAALHTHPALKVWWYGPAAVAWLGGAHSDSRFRRGLGGTLDPGYESTTSNIPFVAMLSGKQGAPTQAIASLIQETKMLNAAFAVGMASLWVLSRGRVR